MTIQFHYYKPPSRDDVGVNRRMFLMTSAMVGVSTAALLATASPIAAAPLTAAQDAALLRMVQDIYPHTELVGLTPYRAIAASIAATADEDPAVRNALMDGLRRIDERAQDLFGMNYVEVEDPDAREGMLRAFQDEPFFQNARWAAYFGIYNNPDLWPRFGYQGSSVEHGGYIDRGFSDITFVPQGPTLEERIARVKG